MLVKNDMKGHRPELDAKNDEKETMLSSTSGTTRESSAFNPKYKDIMLNKDQIVGVVEV